MKFFCLFDFLGCIFWVKIEKKSRFNFLVEEREIFDYNFIKFYLVMEKRDWWWYWEEIVDVGLKYNKFLLGGMRVGMWFRLG